MGLAECPARTDRDVETLMGLVCGGADTLKVEGAGGLGGGGIGSPADMISGNVRGRRHAYLRGQVED